MTELSNVEIIESVLTNICNIISKRTSQSFAASLLYTITKALQSRFNFLKFIEFNIKDSSEEVVRASTELNSINPALVGRAVETIIQIICMDLKEKAGLYFIKEIIENSSEKLVSELERAGIDLALLKIQQNYFYNQQKRMKRLNENPDFVEKRGLLSYCWENVSDCVYDTNNRICKIVGKDGRIMDTLDLDKVVNDYLVELTESESSPPNIKKKIEEKK